MTPKNTKVALSLFLSVTVGCFLASRNTTVQFQVNGWFDRSAGQPTEKEIEIESRQSKLPLDSEINAKTSASNPYSCGSVKTDQGYFPTVSTDNARGKKVNLVHFKSNEFVDLNDPESIYTPKSRCKIFAKRLNDLSKITDPSDNVSLYLEKVLVKGTEYTTINYRLDNCNVSDEAKCKGMLLTASPSKSPKEAGYLLEVLRGSTVDASHKYESSEVRKLYVNDFW